MAIVHILWQKYLQIPNLTQSTRKFELALQINVGIFKGKGNLIVFTSVFIAVMPKVNIAH